MLLRIVWQRFADKLEQEAVIENRFLPQIIMYITCLANSVAWMSWEDVVHVYCKEGSHC